VIASIKAMDLGKKAEDKFGKDRAEELRSELDQLAAELDRLRSASVDLDDAP
jgi:hypothetical protein